MQRHFQFDQIIEQSNSVMKLRQSLQSNEYADKLEVNIKELLKYVKDHAANRLRTTAYIELFNSIDVGIAIIDTDCKIINVNKKYADIIGSSVETVIGKTCYKEFRNTNHICNECPLNNKIDGKGTFVFERNETKENTIIWYQIEVIPLFDDNNNCSGFIELIQNITERKNKEHELLEARERFENAIKASNEGIWDYHIPSNSMYFSERWFRMLGYHTFDFPASYATFQQLCHAQDLIRVTSKVSKMLMSGKDKYEVDLRLKAKDGDWRWVRVKGIVIERDKWGVPVRLSGTNTDIHDLKISENRIRESEERLTMLVESASEGIVIAEVGIIVETNDQLLKMIGASDASKIIGQSVLSLFPEDIQEKMIHLIAKKTASKNKIVNLISLTGNIVPVEINTRAFRYKEKDGRIITFTDISERVDSDQLHREEEERFRMLTEAAFEAIVISENGIIVDFNEQSLKIMGFSNREEFLGSSLINFVAPEYQQKVKENIEKNTNASYSLAVIARDGNKIFIEATGRVFQYKGRSYRVTSMRNVSDKLKAEKALIESEERYRVLFENSITPVLLTNNEGKIVAGNEIFLKITGYSLSEMQLKDFAMFYKNIAERDSFFKILKRNGKLEQYEVELVVKNGAVINVLANSTLILINNEEYILSSFLDITQRKKLDVAIRRVLTEISATSGQLVFDQMVAILANILNSDVAYIGELKSDSIIQAVSCFSKNKVFNHLSISLSDDLKENILTENFFVQEKILLNINEDLASNIPQYLVGLPLTNNENKVVGLIAAYFKQPIKNIEFIHKVMQVFAVRSIVELNRMKSEVALQQSESLYRNTINYSPVGVCLSDVNVHMIMVNQQFCNFLGYSEEELLGNNIEKISHPDYLKKDIKYINQLLAGDINSYSMEKIYIRQNGEEVWGSLTVSLIRDLEGNPLYFNGIIEDINSRKKIEQEIIKSKNRFQTLFEYSPIAIWEEDMSESKQMVEKVPSSILEKMILGSIHVLKINPSVKIVNMNRSALELFKIGSSSEFNALLPKIITRQAVRQLLGVCKAFIAGQYKVNVEQLSYDSEGNQLQLSVQYTIPKGYENNWSRVIVTAIDMAEHLSNERKMLNAIIETEERERSRFARDLHDELGPFLSGIKLFINELGLQDLDKNKRKEMTEYLNQMIDESIDKTKLISYQLMPNVLMDYGLIKAVESFCNKLNFINKINIEIKSNKKQIHLPKTYDIIAYRVIIELINNTLKHAKATKVNIQINESRKRLLINFADNGIGFDINNKLKSSTGIGLQNIIHRLNSIGGTILFESSIRKGMKAEINVPLQK